MQLPFFSIRSNPKSRTSRPVLYNHRAYPRWLPHQDPKSNSLLLHHNHCVFMHLHYLSLCDLQVQCVSGLAYTSCILFSLFLHSSLYNNRHNTIFSKTMNFARQYQKFGFRFSFKLMVLNFVT